LAISQAHQVAGHETLTRSSTVRLVWAGIRRKRGTAQDGKTPALVEDLRAMVTAMAPRRRGHAWRLLELRGRALLLVGFAGAFRRSELVSLNFEDVELGCAGLSCTCDRRSTRRARGARSASPAQHGRDLPGRSVARLSRGGRHHPWARVPRRQPPQPAVTRAVSAIAPSRWW
jgi:hypothetical protein